MFNCTYCGTQFMEHKPNCPNCGAVIKIISMVAMAGGSIREICIKFEETNNLYIDEAIDAKRMKAIRENFSIPGNEKVIMAYDDTILGSNKVGFAICIGGLYWHNDWSVDTKRSRLAWSEFASREVKLNDLKISLGKGDNLGVAGCGSDKVRQAIEEMLREIQRLLS